ncbi:MAG: hypothetical protein U0Y68_02670 [Blastocatellia bacterium]
MKQARAFRGWCAGREKIQAGISPALMAQMDCLATFAALTKQALTAAEEAIAKTSPGVVGEIGRQDAVRLSSRPARCRCARSNGNTSRIMTGAKLNKNTNIELGNDADAQLAQCARRPR